MLRQPRFTVYTAPRWEYGRGRANAAEDVIIPPLTISNHGAREGAVLELQLSVAERAGRSRVFQGSYVVGCGTTIAIDASRTASTAHTFDLFAPIAVSARGSESAAIGFTAGPDGNPLVDAPGLFMATIRARGLKSSMARTRRWS